MILIVFNLVILVVNLAHESTSAAAAAASAAASFVSNHRTRTGWQRNHHRYHLHHHGCKSFQTSQHLLPGIRSRIIFHKLHVSSTNDNDPTTSTSNDSDVGNTTNSNNKNSNNSNVIDNNKSLSDDIIYSLDLKPLLYEVARHAGTKRGRNALLSLVNIDEETSQRSTSLLGQSSLITSSSKRRRAMMTATMATNTMNSMYQDQASTISDSSRSINNSKVKNNKSSYGQQIAPIATSQFDARTEYEYVEQALLCLSNESIEDGNSDNTNKKNSSKNKNSDVLGVPNLTYPPLYSIGSSPEDYTTIINDTDDDEWIYIRSLDRWTLEHILQAEKVIEKLLDVRKWAKLDVTQTWVPLLSQIGRSIDSDDDGGDSDDDDGDDNSSVLQTVHKDISNTVEIVRARSLLDPSGSSVSKIVYLSFVFYPF